MEERVDQVRRQAVASLHTKLRRYRGAIAAVFVLAAFGALSTLGYGGVAASSAYGYGYGYGYEYEYGDAHLIVIKHVVNDNGGGASAANFTMTIGGVTAEGGNSFPGSEAGTNKTVTPGSYTVTETGPAGYSASFSADCVGSIVGGATKTCTVTNNDVGPVRTPGYWKTHPEAIMLGLKLGNYTVASTADALAVFDAMNCSGSKANDAVGCLAGQLLAAKLNLANGNNTCIQPTVTNADSFLASIGYTGPAGTYNLTSAQRATAVALKDALDRYNNKGKC